MFFSFSFSFFFFFIITFFSPSFPKIESKKK